FAARQRRQLEPERVHMRGRDLALDRARRVAEHRRLRHGAEARERRKERPEEVGRSLEVEAVDRLADRGAGLPERAHQDERRQEAEVLAGAREALVEVLVAEAVLA